MNRQQQREWTLFVVGIAIGGLVMAFAVYFFRPETQDEKAMRLMREYIQSIDRGAGK